MWRGKMYVTCDTVAAGQRLHLRGGSSVKELLHKQMKPNNQTNGTICVAVMKSLLHDEEKDHLTCALCAKNDPSLTLVFIGHVLHPRWHSNDAR